MKDIRIRFEGDKGTRLDFGQYVEGKKLYVQKYLVNTVTSKNTDAFYAERGTDLFADATQGAALNTTVARHLGNFASLDTIYFCSYEETAANFNSSDYIQEYGLVPIYYNNTTQSLYFNALFLFRDGTKTEDSLNLTLSS